MRGMKLLLVEDDFDLSGVLARSLSSRGFELLCCADGIEALAAARKKRFDVIVLDLSLPGLDGLELLQRLRGDGNLTPVLVLTARGAVGERIAGLNAGADVMNAVEPLVLNARLLHLEGPRSVSAHVYWWRDGELRCGQLRYEAASNAFYRDQSPLDLSPREAELLKSLMSRVDHVVSKEALRSAVFDDATHMDAVEVLVHRLRKKLQGASVEILTLRGVGYLLCDDASTAAQKA